MKIKIESEQNFSNLDWKSFKNDFQDYETVTQEIFKVLKGCEISSKEPLNLSHFTFYNWPKHYKFIKNKYPKAFEKQYSSFYDEKSPMTLISTVVKSKDFYKGNEIADLKLKKIENILRYLFTDSSYSHSGLKHFDIGIFDFRDKELIESQTVTANSKGGNLKYTGTSRNLVLNKKSLISKKYLNKIWEILDKENPNNVELRILNSIEWIGKAKHEIEKEKAFIQYFIAIESLINVNEISIISPGVSDKIREYASFILVKNKIQRMEIHKQFSYLYGIRSSIVHGSSKNVTKYDLEDVQNFSEMLIIEFLSNKNIISLKDDKNFTELKGLILSMRYK